MTVTPLRSGARQKRSTGSASDFDLAAAFVAEHGKRVRYDATDKCWYIFDGNLWRMDETAQVHALMREVLADRGIGSAKKLSAALAMARIDESIVVTRNAWDTDPHLIGTPAGIFDLRSGKRVPPNPQLLISQRTSVAPAFEPASQWLKFLDQATRGDTAYARYLQQVLGYCCTGLVKFEHFWFAYGDGGGGKGTLFDTLHAALGDYTHKTPSRTLLASQSERHLTELAAFQRRRFVYASETPAGRDFDLPRVKELTGGDPITANRMRQDPFTFMPTHKLVMLSNHAPSVPMIDNSLRRRLIILPFDNIVDETQRDPDLKAHLKERELAAILGWAIQGAVEVLANGFDVPSVVHQATAAYFASHDLMGEWLSERCLTGEKHEDRSTLLLNSWNAFRKEHGEETERSTQFKERMVRRGFHQFKRSEMWWRGVCLRGPMA